MAKRMHNPDSGETINKPRSARLVQEKLDAGFVHVGNQPDSAFQGKTRDELLADPDNGN